MSIAAPEATRLWGLFTSKAELLAATVAHTASQQTALELLLSGAPSGFGCTASLAERFPRLAAGAVAPDPSSTGSADTDTLLFRHPEMVAVGRFAVAETGSIAVNEPAADRGACFLAERLWLLVPEADILATLDEGVRRMRDLVRAGAPHPLLMSGPSRTADIERILTVGVHGPRELVIVILAEP